MRRLGVTGVLFFALSSPALGAATFVISGHGWGHGVGMSQWGAEGLAQHGWSYGRILAHYYPGTSLGREHGATVRVLVAKGLRRIVVSSKRPFRIVDARARRLHFGAGRLRLTPRLLRLTPPLRIFAGAAPLSLNGAGYRGGLVVRRTGRTLSVVNVLPLERYLLGVVPWEMPHRWNPEALRAQAVAARSYALATLNPGWAFDLYADTRDQMYGGIRAEKRSTNRAVGATAGQILTWGGAPALTYYSSTSGGRTESSSDAFHGGYIPYLRSVDDPYDSISPHHSWGPRRFSARTIARRLGVPNVADVIERWNASGRVAAVALRWRGGTHVVAGERVMSALGLPSTWFTVRVVHANGPAHTHARAAGYVVVLASIPFADRRPQPLPGTRVARSDDLGGLRPGYWVVYRGPYASRREAEAHAGGGYVRRVGR